MKQLAILFFSLLVLACGRPSSSSDNDSKASAEEIKDSAALRQYVFEDQKLHRFSDPAQQDTFKLHVTGDKNDLQHARIHFQILAPGGKEIYSDTFEGTYLLDYGLMERVKNPEDLNDSIRNDYIRERLNRFFADENFKSPAVKSDATFDNYYQSRELFEELKKKPEAISFYYLLGKEDGKSIVYSEKEQKAVLFYNCC